MHVEGVREWERSARKSSTHHVCGAHCEVEDVVVARDQVGLIPPSELEHVVPLLHPWQVCAAVEDATIAKHNTWPLLLDGGIGGLCL
jgi:hypothetical protein